MRLSVWQKKSGINTGVSVVPVSCEQLRKEDITQILEQVLYEFPVSEIRFYIPKWVEMLPADHELKGQIIGRIRELMKSLVHIKDVTKEAVKIDGPYVQDTLLDEVNLSDGVVRVRLQIRDEYYYQILSELCGVPMESEYDLIHTMKELAQIREEYVK